MARLVCTLGFTVLAVAVVLLVAGEAGFAPGELVDVWFMPILQFGGAALVAGLLLSLLAPFGRMARRGRCIRCSVPIEKSQTYCHDHLKTTLQEYEDHARNRS